MPRQTDTYRVGTFVGEQVRASVPAPEERY